MDEGTGTACPRDWNAFLMTAIVGCFKKRYEVAYLHKACITCARDRLAGDHFQGFGRTLEFQRRMARYWWQCSLVLENNFVACATFCVCNYLPSLIVFYSWWREFLYQINTDEKGPEIEFREIWLSPSLPVNCFQNCLNQIRYALYFMVFYQHFKMKTSLIVAMSLLFIVKVLLSTDRLSSL